MRKRKKQPEFPQRWKKMLFPKPEKLSREKRLPPRQIPVDKLPGPEDFKDQTSELGQQPERLLPPDEAYIRDEEMLNAREQQKKIPALVEQFQKSIEEMVNRVERCKDPQGESEEKSLNMAVYSLIQFFDTPAAKAKIAEGERSFPPNF